MSSVQTCDVCKGTTFDIIDGNYFCMKCLTQNDNIQEHLRETRVDSTTRVRSLGKINTKKSQKPVQIDGWTSWELYNFILHGITNEAIELGASPDVKLTVLQLWATYLGKIEAAFTSTTKKCIPKLARKYYKRDAEILYGRIMQRKKRKKRRTSTTSTSSVISSFQSTKSISSRTSKKKIEKFLAEEYEKPNSADDSLSSVSASQSLLSLESSLSQASSTKSKIKFNKAARQEAKKVKEKARKIPYSKQGKYKKEHVTTQYKLGPQVITPMKLWVILYLALRIHDQNIHLSDMLRYGREGHLSYYKLDHLLPSEVSITKKDMRILSQSNELTHKGFRRVAAGVAKFLGVELYQPYFLPIVEQYCQELQLPRGILLYTERMMALSPPKMIFNEKSSYTPNYEGRAMAFIVVAMKMLFGLDGITEYEISRVTEKLNREANEKGVFLSKLFSFCEWQRFIECRRTILTDVHFPTKLRYNPESPGNTHLYLRFLGLLQSKREGEQQPRVTDYKHSLPELLKIGFQSCFETLNEKIMPVKEIEIFPPSLTPQKSYIEHILNDPLNDLPDILKRNFFETKVGYTTKPELLQELAMQCDIKLKVINTNLHFIEKKVSEFEQPRMPSIQSLNETVIVNDPGINTDISVKSENLFDYVHRKTESKITINITKNKYYDNVKTNVINQSESAFSHELSFDQVGEDGKLLIGNDNDFGNENVSRVDFSPFDKDSLLRKDFCDRYNLSLSKHEQQAVLRPGKVLSKRRQIQKTFCRNAQGKFVRKSEQKSNNKANQNINAHCMSETREENVESDVESISDASSISEGDNFNNAVPLHSENLFDLHDSDISILEDFSESRRSRNLEHLQLFRPFKDYWMYHCIFSRVKPKNFELFEKQLPVSFRWFLRECADTIEMSTEDLYEEICLVEAYFSHILKPKDTKVKAENPIAKSYHNTILNKW